MSQTSKIIFAVTITVIIIGGGFYFWQQQKIKNPTTSNKTNNQKSSTITIMVPENYDLYQQKMTQFVQEGGNDPLKTIQFIKKEITVPYTDNIIKVSAQAAAEEIAPSGGTPKASIAYLKVQDGTAYLLLDIDLDGWAGVSVSRAILHPLVERTLVQFPEIKNVVFDYSPGDKKEGLQSVINQQFNTCIKENNCCLKNEDCEFIWFTGYCNTPEYVQKILKEARERGDYISEVPRNTEKITCACENQKCITNKE